MDEAPRRSVEGKSMEKQSVPGSAGLLLEDGGQAVAAGGADRDQRPAGALLVEELGGGRDDPGAGRRKRVTRRQRGAVDVQLRAVHRAQRSVEAELLLRERRVLPGLERGEHLRG